MEKVVYLLGAGFSAPLGIPIMNNFLTKAKDIYFNNTERYSHFKAIFDIIKEMAYSKNYYKCDLSNIEEILSILEMQERFSNKRLKKPFIKFIVDVINYYSPEFISKTDNIPINWPDYICMGQKERSYSYFLGSLFNFTITYKTETDYEQKRKQFRISKSNKVDKEYAIITLNYDLIPEKICSLFNSLNSTNENISFSKSHLSKDLSISIALSKLHGSIEGENIIPPTWNKTLDENIQFDWKLAFSLLESANHIRILGYSLPETDAYFKYLLKASVIKNPHLKSIDVVCLDDFQGSVKQRYNNFIEKKYFRFLNKDINNYFELLSKKTAGISFQGDTISFNKLEKTHEEFFEE